MPEKNYNKNSQPAGLLKIVRDISARKEEWPANKKRKLNLISNGSRDGEGVDPDADLEKVRTLSQNDGKSTVTLPKAPEEPTSTADRLNSPDRLSKPRLSEQKKFSSESRPKSTNESLKARAIALWESRKTLPVWSHSDELREGLRQKDIMLVAGETGSGKSTQVPQLLVQEPWCKSQTQKIVVDGVMQTIKVGGCIAITEPRRVAAISLARRVAEEMGTPLGSSSPASKVGYSVRFDNSTSPNTQIKFLTEGMLLQEMLRDPSLKQYSAVIVDEVHERGANVDLILGFLRIMVTGKNEGRGGIPLKVAIMSATVDVQRFLEFFEQGYQSLELEANEHPAYGETSSDLSDVSIQEEVSEWSGFSSDDDEKPEPGRSNGFSRDETATNLNIVTIGNGLTEEKPCPHVAICRVEGRQYPVEVIYSPKPVQDIVDASLHLIFQINYKEPMPGDILVFLTGQKSIESLEDLVKRHALDLNPDLPRLQVLPLFGALPQAAQQRVFQPATRRTRKVILATNIAETSVTVPGVRYVIDGGKAKVKQFRSEIGLDSLLTKPISKAAATQRRGRAGREAAGICYRLYTEGDFSALAESDTPEILRCDFSQAILTMKARGVDDILKFPFLDRPPRKTLEKALVQLLQVNALTESGGISKIGVQMAKLPLSVCLARALLAAAEPAMDCVSEVIDIISCLSVENIFLNLTSEEKNEEAEVARRELYRREGDHLTLLALLKAYAGEKTDKKAWAERHFVSHRAMQAAMVIIPMKSGSILAKLLQDVRKQLRAQSKHEESANKETVTSSETTERILKCFLQGFATNVARLSADGTYKTLMGNQNIAIHPSSVLFGKKVEAIVYNEFVYTTRSYARGVSAIQAVWLQDVFSS